jgi:Putative adhesin
MSAPMTQGRRALLTLGVPFSLLVIGYGSLSLVDVIGLTSYTQSLSSTPIVHVLNVDTASGSVTIEGSPDADVHVTAKGFHTLTKPKVTSTSTSTGVAVTGDCNDNGVLLCTQNLVIEVPVAFQVNVKSSGGSVRILGLTGPLDLHSSGGDIHVDSSVGRLTLDSSGGDVHVTNSSSTDVTASSSAGDVDLAFVVAPSRVQATSSAGDVTVQVPNSVGYRVTATASAGSSHVTVHTDSESSRTIDAHSSAGDVTVKTAG